MIGPSLQGGGAPALGDEQSPTWNWKLDFALLVDGTLIASMRSDPEGRRVLADPIPRPPGVLESERLANLPREPLGFEYHRHCRENTLDPKLISVESEKVARERSATPEHVFVYDRYRDSHDFWHVPKGYGTDRAGEAGIIAWTFAQTGNRPYPVIHMADAPGTPDPTGSLE